MSIAPADGDSSAIVIAPGQHWVGQRPASDLVIVKKSTLSPGRWLVRRCATNELTTISAPQLIGQYRLVDS